MEKQNKKPSPTTKKARATTQTPTTPKITTKTEKLKSSVTTMTMATTKNDNPETTHSSASTEGRSMDPETLYDLSDDNYYRDEDRTVYFDEDEYREE